MASLLSRVFGALSTASPFSATGQAFYRGNWGALRRPAASAFRDWMGRPAAPGRVPEMARPEAVEEPDGFVWEDPSTWSHPGTLVSSSNLAEVWYDDLRYVMQIRFVKAGPNNGDTYRYAAVPPHIYHGLMNAPSKGRYHHANIRCTFSYSDISGISQLQGCGKAPHIGTGLPLSYPRASRKR